MHLQSILVSSGTDPLKESLVPVTHCYYYPEMELISILVPRHSLRDQPSLLQEGFPSLYDGSVLPAAHQ